MDDLLQKMESKYLLIGSFSFKFIFIFFLSFESFQIFFLFLLTHFVLHVRISSLSDQFLSFVDVASLIKVSLVQSNVLKKQKQEWFVIYGYITLNCVQLNMTSTESSVWFQFNKMESSVIRPDFFPITFNRTEFQTFQIKQITSSRLVTPTCKIISPTAFSSTSISVRLVPIISSMACKSFTSVGVTRVSEKGVKMSSQFI